MWADPSPIWRWRGKGAAALRAKASCGASRERGRGPSVDGTSLMDGVGWSPANGGRSEILVEDSDLQHLLSEGIRQRDKQRLRRSGIEEE